MNILMVHPHDLFDKSEPWTIRITSIAKEFIRHGHNVKLCYFPLTVNDNHLPRTIDSIELIPLDRTPSPGIFISNIIKILRLCSWTDVVHFQKCQHYASIPTLIAAYISGKPLHYDWDDWEEKIWYESCGRSLHSRFIGFSFKILERWLPFLSDSVSCSSGYLKKLSYKFGVKKEYIFDAPVGADMEQFKPGLDGGWVRNKYGIQKDLILYIGQLHGAQYVDLLIKAANIVLHKRQDARFMVVGEGFFGEKLRRATQILGIEDKVIFTGAVKHEDIPFYIAAATVCVAPFDDTEVTRCKSPLKIAEYLASGKPIVANLVGEVRNMVGGVGVLAEPGDHRSFANGILQLLENNAMRNAISKRARTRAERKYNWTYTADSLLSAYAKIV